MVAVIEMMTMMILTMGRIVVCFAQHRYHSLLLRRSRYSPFVSSRTVTWHHHSSAFVVVVVVDDPHHNRNRNHTTTDNQCHLIEQDCCCGGGCCCCCYRVWIPTRTLAVFDPTIAAVVVVWRTSPSVLLTTTGENLELGTRSTHRAWTSMD